MRGALAVFLILLGGLLLPVASVLVWAERDLADRDRFAELSVEGLRDQASIDAIATVAVSRLQRVPGFGVFDAGEARASIARLLRTPGATEVFENVAYDAYPLVVGGERGPLVADLSPIYTEFLAELGLPDLLGGPPRQLRAVRLARAGDLPALGLRPGTLGWLAPAVSGLALLLLLLGVAVARSRGWALAGAGILVFAGGVLVLGAVQPLRDGIVEGVEGTSARIVTQEALERLGEGLSTQGIVVAAAGLAAGALGALLIALRR